MRNLMPLCYNCNKERSSKYIVPEEFYCFASEEVIKDCKAYLRKYRRERKSMG